MVSSLKQKTLQSRLRMSAVCSTLLHLRQRPATRLTQALFARLRFLFLGRNFNYASKALSIAVKVTVNQAVFTPVFNSYFFGMQAVLTGEGPHGVITRIKGTVPISIVNSLKLWPAVTAFSFWFIMPQYRFMFSGIFAVAWQGYLSFLNRKEEKIEEKIDSIGHPVIPDGVIVK